LAVASARVSNMAAAGLGGAKRAGAGAGWGGRRGC
jgi:hypothetical protein